MDGWIMEQACASGKKVHLGWEEYLGWKGGRERRNEVRKDERKEGRREDKEGRTKEGGREGGRLIMVNW